MSVESMSELTEQTVERARAVLGGTAEPTRALVAELMAELGRRMVTVAPVMEAADVLDLVARGRRYYADGCTHAEGRPLTESFIMLDSESSAFESAVSIARGDTSGLWRLLPTHMWPEGA